METVPSGEKRPRTIMKKQQIRREFIRNATTGIVTVGGVSCSSPI